MPDSEDIETILRSEGCALDEGLGPIPLKQEGQPEVENPIQHALSTADWGVQIQLDPTTTLTVPDVCTHCRAKDANHVCPTCRGVFCSLCESFLDPRYCKRCLDETAAHITEGPLIGPDGVTHEGRDLKPDGLHFGTHARRISEMSDYQLEAHIGEYKELVRQAERSLEFRRVILGSAQVEKGEREHAARRKLRNSGYKVKPPTPKTPLAQARAVGDNRKADSAKMTAALGVDPSLLLKALAELANKKK